eukprot:GHVR01079434.1.p1 GENE.GHVR01079434.1~~GHVR01079434.1.p1  ORF type:complete len:168 (+),score=28.25 GHVR01079434.1:101-604(+)
MCIRGCIGQTSIHGILSGTHNFNNCKVVIDGGVQESLVTAAGVFSFSSVSRGVHLVEVFHNTAVFDPVLVEISLDLGVSKSAVKAYLRDAEIGYGQRLKYPLRLNTRENFKFFETPESFNILNILKSPMVIIMLVSITLMVLLPKAQNANEQVETTSQQTANRQAVQ